jgi:hypothetical protein
VCNQPFTLLNPHICAYKAQPIDQERSLLEDPVKRKNPPPIIYTATPASEALPRPGPLVHLPPTSIPQPLPVQAETSITAQSGLLQALKGISPVPAPAKTVPKAPADTAQKLQIEGEAKMLDEAKKFSQVEFSREVSFGVVSAAGANPQTVQCKVSPGKDIAILEGHPETVYSAVWHPSKKLLVTSGNFGVANLWKVNDPKGDSPLHAGGMTDIEKPHTERETIFATIISRLPHFKNDVPDAGSCVLSSNWSSTNMLVTGTNDEIVKVWDENGKLSRLTSVGCIKQVLWAAEGFVMAAKWNPSGTHILAVGGEKKFNVKARRNTE